MTQNLFKDLLNNYRFLYSDEVDIVYSRVKKTYLQSKISILLRQPNIILLFYIIENSIPNVIDKLFQNRKLNIIEAQDMNKTQ